MKHYVRAFIHLSILNEIFMRPYIGSKTINLDNKWFLLLTAISTRLKKKKHKI